MVFCSKGNVSIGMVVVLCDWLVVVCSELFSFSMVSVSLGWVLCCIIVFRILLGFLLCSSCGLVFVVSSGVRFWLNW